MEFNFKFRTSSRYIGVYIGTKVAKEAWLELQIREWVEGVKLLAGAAKKYPQSSFAGLTKSLQTEWTYLQQVVPDVEEVFAPVERAIKDFFLPALLGEKEVDIPLRDLMVLPVKLAGLGIPDPTKDAP